MSESTESLAAILAPLNERREQLEEQRQQLRDQITVIGEELTQIQRVLKAGGFASPNGNKPAKRTSPQKPAEQRVSEARIDAVLAFINKRGEVGVREIVEGLGVVRSSVDAAISVLRSREQVRFVRTQAGARGKSFAIYGPWERKQ